jgi:hypothetical protein
MSATLGPGTRFNAPVTFSRFVLLGVMLVLSMRKGQDLCSV